MGWLSGVVVFIMIWWTVIFCVLPLWVKRDKRGPEITASGAPENPQIGRKLAITTGISIVLWLGVYALIQSNAISFREIAKNMAAEQQYLDHKGESQ